MKRYYLHQKEGTDTQAIANFAVLHESHRKIIVTYAHVQEPKQFVKTLKANCQNMQAYNLTTESPALTKTNSKDYLVLGINDVAMMIYFAEFKDSQWLAEYKLELLAPKSFYLRWDNQDKFVVDWA